MILYMPADLDKQMPQILWILEVLSGFISTSTGSGRNDYSFLRSLAL